jgi:hypothetical protein
MTSNHRHTFESTETEAIRPWIQGTLAFPKIETEAQTVIALA